MIRTRTMGLFACMVAVAALGCGDGDGENGNDTADLTVLLEAEDTITEGLDPGDEGESIQDGWQIRWGKYLTAVGNIQIEKVGEDVEASVADVFVVDLAAIPEAGVALWTLDSLAGGDWDFNYSTPSASASAMRDDTVDETDYDEMVANGWTYLITGTASQDDGVSCPPPTLADPPDGVDPVGTNDAGDDCYDNSTITFTFGVDAATDFGPCEVDEIPGFSIPEGGSQTIAATIHGDHMFFNGFPEEDEGGVMRLAQWLADSDLDLDGEVTRAELEAIAPADLSEIDDRYQLGGSPITPLTSMWDFLTAQLQTQGHFQGEGECPLGE